VAHKSHPTPEYHQPAWKAAIFRKKGTSTKMGDGHLRKEEVLDEKPPCGTPTGFMFGNYGNSTCKYLKKWGNLTKCNVVCISLNGEHMIYLNWFSCTLNLKL
jgi:hypothetical protein